MLGIVRNIQSLIDKAAKSANALEAMQYSQAATNAANALGCLLAQDTPEMRSALIDPLKHDGAES